MENPIKMDDLGVPLFSETSIFGRYGKIGAYITQFSVSKRDDFSRKYIFQPLIFRGHVSF